MSERGGPGGAPGPPRFFSGRKQVELKGWRSGGPARPGAEDRRLPLAQQREGFGPAEARAAHETGEMRTYRGWADVVPGG